MRFFIMLSLLCFGQLFAQSNSLLNEVDLSTNSEREFRFGIVAKIEVEKSEPFRWDGDDFIPIVKANYNYGLTCSWQPFKKTTAWKIISEVSYRYGEHQASGVPNLFISNLSGFNVVIHPGTFNGNAGGQPYLGSNSSWFPTQNSPDEVITILSIFNETMRFSQLDHHLGVRWEPRFRESSFTYFVGLSFVQSLSLRIKYKQDVYNEFWELGPHYNVESGVGGISFGVGTDVGIGYYLTDNWYFAVAGSFIHLPQQLEWTDLPDRQFGDTLYESTPMALSLRLQRVW